MKSLTGHLYFWVLLAIVTGGTIGYVSPETGVALKPLGDGFIALVKMLIGPIIFCTVVLGIAGAGDMKKVGRVGGKALLYFEVVSTFALAIGLLVANLVRPGAGFNADPATLDSRADDYQLPVRERLDRGRKISAVDYLRARDTRIVVSGELDEFAIAALAAAPVDAYGAGTAVVTGSGAPTANRRRK